MQERHSNREQYFEELAISCQKYFIPYLNQFVKINPAMRILEIGCGDGGNLLPFAQKGCDVTGVDISEKRITDARSFFQKKNVCAELVAADIFNVSDFDGRFDVVLIHDVIEHIGRKEEFLNHVGRFLAPEGVLFIGFPAWHMPFGGHQQICRHKLASHFPFLHLLPAPLYRSVLTLLGENRSCIDELLDIKRCGLTVEGFEKLLRKTPYDILERQLWLINPHYEVKFGLAPRKLAGSIAAIPYLRNFVSSSCFYILKCVN
ncbi:MAG: class I SAM-dependent methyltransferase [Bacteroidales bacterium]